MKVSNPVELNSGEIDFALCRSILYEVLSVGFREPTPETLRRLTSKDQIAFLIEAATLLDRQFPTSNRESLLSFIHPFTGFSNIDQLEMLQNSYHKLFGHVAHAKVPPYETEYGEETLFQQPQQLGDISGFLNAFGVKLNTEKHERFDHVSCECEFLCFLTRKEAYGLEQKNETMYRETRNAERLFLRDHLGRFVPSFVKLLRRENPGGFYSILGDLCYSFVFRECEYFKVPMGPETMRLRPLIPMDECLTCGAGEEGKRTIEMVKPQESESP